MTSQLRTNQTFRQHSLSLKNRFFASCGNLVVHITSASLSVLIAKIFSLNRCIFFDIQWKEGACIQT